jgi:hypothetical protein
LTDADRWTISSFRLNATTGLVVSLSAESVNLTRGQPTATVQVSVQAPGFLPGDAIYVGLEGAAAPRPVTIVGGPARAYVLAPNSTKQVDGLFADWTTDTIADTDPSPVNNSDADIARVGAAAGGASAYFFLEVEGILMRGSLPQRLVRTITGGGGGGPSNGTPEPRRTGEDILRVYVDVNASDPGGTPIGGIFADYLVEVRGSGGRVTTRAAFTWSSAWTRIPGSPVDVEKDSSAIEGKLTIPSTTADVRMVFETTDWSGIGDITSPVTASVLPSSSPPSPTPPIQIYAPEFGEVAIPIALTAFVVLLVGWRRRRASSAAAPAGSTRQSS